MFVGKRGPVKQRGQNSTSHALYMNNVRSRRRCCNFHAASALITSQLCTTAVFRAAVASQQQMAAGERKDGRAGAVARRTTNVIVRAIAHPQDRLSALNYSAAKTIPIPDETVSDSYRQDISNATLFGAGILLAVEQKSIDVRSRGGAIARATTAFSSPRWCAACPWTSSRTRSPADRRSSTRPCRCCSSPDVRKYSRRTIPLD